MVIVDRSVRVDEIGLGTIAHALVMSIDNSCAGIFRAPAVKTDGDSTRPDCTPQGARLQLDPAVDVDTLPGITAAERAVGKALQTHGVYVIDKGGAPMGNQLRARARRRICEERRRRLQGRRPRLGLFRHAPPSVGSLACPAAMGWGLTKGLPVALDPARVPYLAGARGGLIAMAHVRFGPGEGGCPACFILRSGIQPDEQAPCGIALGLATVAMAESPLEIGELFAQACPEHQRRITQFVVAFSEMAGVDYHPVMARLGARPSGPGAAPTLIHLAEGDRTRCGQRALADRWPEDERFVYARNSHQVTCQACRQDLGQT